MGSSPILDTGKTMKLLFLAKAVVLDDDVDAAVSKDGWMFAHTSFSTGLTEELTNQIIEFLGER